MSEVVAEPGLTEHLISAVSRVASKQLLAAAGRVFAFVGAKGGIGTTTVAVNAATALGRPGRRALLVDLHEGDGDAATFLNATPSRTIANACESVHRLDERYLRGLVVPVAAHVDLLAASDIKAPHAIDAPRLRAVMQRAAAAYPFVVIDVSPSHVPLLASIDALAEVFVVTSQEFVSLKRGRRLADGLKAWDRDGRVSAVLNRFNPSSDISERDVERVLGLELTRTIPNDYPRAAAAMGRGRPVVFGETSPLREAILGLAERLAGEPAAQDAPPSPRGGFLQRLARVS